MHAVHESLALEVDKSAAAAVVEREPPSVQGVADLGALVPPPYMAVPPPPPPRVPDAELLHARELETRWESARRDRKAAEDAEVAVARQHQLKKVELALKERRCEATDQSLAMLAASIASLAK